MNRKRGKMTSHPAPFFLASRYSLSVWALIAANLIPVAGVLFAGWETWQLLLLFWAESAVIGLFNILKMLRIGGLRALFLAMFFTVHYGGFMAGHLLFIYSLFGSQDGAAPSLTPLLGDFLDMAPALMAFLISHGISFFRNFLGAEEYRDRSLNRQMAAPYKRIILMHVSIIFGGFLAESLDSALPALLLLIALKLAVDLWAHRKSHHKTAVETPRGETRASSSSKGV